MGHPSKYASCSSKSQNPFLPRVLKRPREQGWWQQDQWPKYCSAVVEFVPRWRCLENCLSRGELPGRTYGGERELGRAAEQNLLTDMKQKGRASNLTPRLTCLGHHSVHHDGCGVTPETVNKSPNGMLSLF